MEALDRFNEVLKKYYDTSQIEIWRIDENENIILARIRMINKNADIIPGVFNLYIEKQNPKEIHAFNPFKNYKNPDLRFKGFKVVWEKK